MATGMLRIAVWHNLPSGGAKRALHDHVRGLVARGHHVEAWCPPQAHRHYLPLSELITEHVVDLDLATPRPLRLLSRLGLRTNAPRIVDRVDEHCRAVAQAVGNEFDVLLASTCQVLAVPPIALHANVPTVLYLQEPNRPLYEALPVLPWLEGGHVARDAVIRASAELRAVRAFDRVLVNSRFSRESLLRAFAVDAELCYLGVDTERFVPVGAPTRDFFVGVGSFSSAKGVETVLRAIAATAARPPLVWVGNIVQSEEYFSSLPGMAATLGVDLRLHRGAEEAELHGFLQNARALVYAPRLEPFGYAPLEANACGTAVVGVAEGGVRETVVDGRNGLLVDLDGLPDAIDHLWRDKVVADALGAAGRAHVVEHWSIDGAIDRLEQQLRRVALQ